MRWSAPRSATAWVAIVTAAFWLVAYLGRLEIDAAIAMGFIPDRWSGAVLAIPAVPAILTPLSATLVHAGIVHLILNLIILVWCGTAVERILGNGPFLFIYAVAAYAAAAAQWLVDPHGQVPMVGASGAISGIIGAFALSFGQQKQIVRSRALNRALNAAWLLAAWIVLQIMTGMLAGMQGMLLATPAHVGGFLAGLALQRPLLLWKYRKA
ncbi:MAG TPA: rhomboid family intramembrane serine protease [Sphingomicrobium sp.]|nr:rhomboid family intramembrane serine protease [Sphingomicrobium sp.]